MVEDPSWAAAFLLPTGARPSPGGAAARHEFRCWPDDTTAPRRALAAGWADGGMAERDDIYLVPRRPRGGSPPTLVKLRGGKALDVKALDLDTPAGAGGLELWRPVLRADFPLAPGPARRLAREFGLGARAMATAARSPAHATALLAEPERAVLVCNLHKVRRRYETGSCLAEVTTVRTRGRILQTVCLESENPRAVLDARDALGLARWPNENYGARLRELFSP